MIVMIALLNDGAILSIAYDNVRYSSKPEAWNMRRVLGVSTVLGVIGVVSAFLLFWLGERVFPYGSRTRPDPDVPEAVCGRTSHHLPHPDTRSVLDDQASESPVDGCARHADRCHPDRCIRPLHDAARAGSLQALSGAYAILWALFTDRIKLLAYRILDPSALPLLAKETESTSDLRYPKRPMNSSSNESTRRKPAGPGLA